MVLSTASSGIGVDIHYSLRLIGLVRASESLRLLFRGLMVGLSSENHLLLRLIIGCGRTTFARRERNIIELN